MSMRSTIRVVGSERVVSPSFIGGQCLVEGNAPSLLFASAETTERFPPGAWLVGSERLQAQKSLGGTEAF